jgi:hypothetical protein
MYIIQTCFTLMLILPLGLLHRIDVGSVSDVSEIHAPFVFRITTHLDPEDGSTMYVRNDGNNSHTCIVQIYKTITSTMNKDEIQKPIVCFFKFVI